MDIQKKFEELLGILGLEYLVHRQNERTATVTSQENTDNPIQIRLENATIIIYINDDASNVLYFGEDASTGRTALDIEKILIRHEHPGHEPLALSIYLYYRLLGTLWGLKADPSIRNMDPTAGHMAITRLTCIEQGKRVVYTYMIDIYGNIIVEKPGDTIRFHPEYYLQKPEKTISSFLGFFKDADRIIAAEKG